MEFIAVGPENIDQEHICCAITDKKGETCVSSKKSWMKERFADGLTFRKLDARGKVFIEYIPAEKAWCPIDAEGYMHINCFWVSGQYKGQGYADQLLFQCAGDARARGMLGLTVLSSAKKMPFLSDPGYLKYKGFTLADSARPNYQLLFLPFDQNAPVPKFRDCVRDGRTVEQGIVLYYTNQCPHTAKYVPILCETVRRCGAEMTLHKIETVDQAQNAPAPFTTYSLFYNGDFVTNEILSEKKIEKFLASAGLA